MQAAAGADCTLIRPLWQQPRKVGGWACGRTFERRIATHTKY